MSGFDPADCAAVRRSHYANAPRRPVQICASLVQNPTNLGGLCRTAEVFRMEALVLADLGIVESSAFYKPAVSAQLWQPLQSCAPDALPQWLAQQKQVGYSLLALQMGPEAIPLTQFSFPERVVLVLGRELTGVPSEVLAQCDRAIAIPQYGLVESLNVQTAAAIALYEYVRQYPLLV